MRDTQYGGSFNKPDIGKSPYWIAFFISTGLALATITANKKPKVMSKVHTTEFDNDYSKEDREALNAIAGGYSE
tara:strand:+ start:680 stop:901 length:222 start_codon:yes stop_codon:yes gene_type:complete